MKEEKKIKLTNKEITEENTQICNLKTQKTDPIILINSFNDLIQNTTDFLEKVSNIMELRVEMERIKAQAEVFIKALELDHQRFLEREKNTREYINQLLNNLERLHQRVLDKALAINLSSCNEQEYNFLMTVLDQIEKFTFRLMDTIDKYIGEK